MNLTPIFGTDPLSVRRRLQLTPEAPLLDFSSRINPLGFPQGVAAAAAQALTRLDQYPESGCPRLTERIAALHGIDPRRVIVGAGVTELISLIGQSLRDVLAFHAQALGDLTLPVAHLVDPCSTAFRRISSRNELRAKVWGEHVLGWAQDVLPKAAAGIFWTGHPNNPTGRVWDRATVREFAAGSLGLLTVVDETSLPFWPDEAERTLVPVAATRDNVLVLRSFSHFYGMPGLRVGYAIAPPDMVTRLRQFQDADTVTAVAEAAALAALDDDEFAARTVDLVPRYASRLLDQLWEIPEIQPAWPARDRPESAPPAPPFILVSLTQTDWTSIRLHEALARRGFLVRECSDFPGLEVGSFLTGPDQLIVTGGQLRINVRTPELNERLLETLAELLRTGPSQVD